MKLGFDDPEQYEQPHAKFTVRHAGLRDAGADPEQLAAAIEPLGWVITAMDTVRPGQDEPIELLRPLTAKLDELIREATALREDLASYAEPDSDEDREDLADNVGVFHLERVWDEVNRAASSLSRQLVD